MLQRVQQRILLKRHSVCGRTCMTILILLAIACVSAFVVRCLWEVQFSGKYLFLLCLVQCARKWTMLMICDDEVTTGPLKLENVVGVLYTATQRTEPCPTLMPP